MDDKIYFVWLASYGNFHCQKWYGDQSKTSNSKSKYSDKELVFKKELTGDEERMNLEQLAKIYPAPERNENAS